MRFFYAGKDIYLRDFAHYDHAENRKGEVQKGLERETRTGEWILENVFAGCGADLVEMDLYLANEFPSIFFSVGRDARSRE